MPDDPASEPATESLPSIAATEPAGAVRPPTVTGLPGGYVYGVTRYADVILQASFPRQFADLIATLDGFRITVGELRAGGGGRTPFVKRFDESLGQRAWGAREIEIGKTIDGRAISAVRSHTIDMFSAGQEDEPYPGIAVEMEWNNKDPFYDRDLINYQALHREGALAVGVIVTRGRDLQRLIKRTVLNAKGEEKYGESSTHWRKLVDRVNLGGGGECPLLLVGIEPARIVGVAELRAAERRLAEADAFRRTWRQRFQRWEDAKPYHDELLAAAHDQTAPAEGGRNG